MFPSIRKLPQNIQGQYTNKDGLRYYPTLWILADIEFKYIEIDGIKSNFEFKTRYPPHVSLACVAVQLDVNKVQKLEQRQMQTSAKPKSSKVATTNSNKTTNSTHRVEGYIEKTGTK